MSRIIKIKCRCGTEFSAFISQRRKYCSRSCQPHVSKPRPDMIGNSYGLGYRHTAEARKFISECQRGNKHPRWVLDRTKVKRQHERNNPQYKQWRREVWLRDNFKCKIANPDCKGRIEAHHILGWTLHPELRYEVNNGITLCHHHHPRKSKDELELSPYFQSLVREMK